MGVKAKSCQKKIYSHNVQTPEKSNLFVLSYFPLLVLYLVYFMHQINETQFL